MVETRPALRRIRNRLPDGAGREPAMVMIITRSIGRGGALGQSSRSGERSKVKGCDSAHTETDPHAGLLARQPGNAGRGAGRL